MRTASILLGVFGGLILGQQVYIPIQLRLLSGGGDLRPGETVLIALFVCWAVATALIQRLPGVAVWVFSLGGVAGILLGARFDEAPLIVWGVLANGLAVLAVLSHREWRQAELAQRARDQHLAAIAAAVLTAAPPRSGEPGARARA